MRTNIAEKKDVRTAEGAKASVINAEQQLRRSVMTCMLWEDIHYESGEDVASRIAAFIPHVKAQKVSTMAIEARTKMKLRHVPLFIVREMARHKTHLPLVSETLAAIVQRADELSEFLSLYWKDGKCPLAAQVKKGLAKAFQKFSAYDLAKYNQDASVKLRDVLFLCHAKPKDEVQADLWKKLIDGKLESPDTWEVELSASKDKNASWMRLLKENKLGGLALLRNLRNMAEAKVGESLIRESLSRMRTDRVLPFRFITAAKYAPQLEDALESAMYRATGDAPKLRGKTVFVVDVSGSMFSAGNVSKHSELTRVDAAAALAILVREIAEEPVIYATAGDDSARVHATRRVPARRGFGLRDAILKDMAKEMGRGGIFLTQCLTHIKNEVGSADRLIVLTDEQDCDLKLNPATADAFARHNYIVNVSVEKNGIGYGKFTKIDGWSEAVLDFIRESENTNQVQEQAP